MKTLFTITIVVITSMMFQVIHANEETEIAFVITDNARKAEKGGGEIYLRAVWPTESDLEPFMMKYAKPLLVTKPTWGRYNGVGIYDLNNDGIFGFVDIVPNGPNLAQFEFQKYLADLGVPKSTVIVAWTIDDFVRVNMSKPADLLKKFSKGAETQ